MTIGIAPVKGRLRHLVKVGQLDPPVISNWRKIKGLTRSNDDAETEHLQRSSECECEPTLGGSSLAARSTHHRLQREPPGGRRPPPGGLKQRETQKLRSPLIPTLEACRRGRNLRVSYKDPAKHREALRKACHRYYRSYRENLNVSV